MVRVLVADIVTLEDCTAHEDHQLEVPTPFRSRLQKYDQDVQFPLSCGLPQQCFYIP